MAGWLCSGWELVVWFFPLWGYADACSLVGRGGGFLLFPWGGAAWWGRGRRVFGSSPTHVGFGILDLLRGEVLDK